MGAGTLPDQLRHFQALIHAPTSRWVTGVHRVTLRDSAELAPAM